MNITARHVSAQNVAECPKCGGKGSTKAYCYGADGKLVIREKVCRSCKGTGYVEKKEVKSGTQH